MLTAMEHMERAENLLGYVQENPDDKYANKLVNRARLHVEMAQYKKQWVEGL